MKQEPFAVNYHFEMGGGNVIDIKNKITILLLENRVESTGIFCSSKR